MDENATEELAPQWREVTDFLRSMADTLRTGVPSAADLERLFYDLSQKVVIANEEAPHYNYSQESDVTLIAWLVFIRAFKCSLVTRSLDTDYLTTVRIARQDLGYHLEIPCLVALFQAHLQPDKDGPIEGLHRIAWLLVTWIEEHNVVSVLGRRLGENPVGDALLAVILSTGNSTIRDPKQSPKPTDYPEIKSLLRLLRLQNVTSYRPHKESGEDIQSTALLKAIELYRKDQAAALEALEPFQPVPPVIWPFVQELEEQEWWSALREHLILTEVLPALELFLRYKTAKPRSCRVGFIRLSEGIGTNGMLKNGTEKRPRWKIRRTRLL
jgi:hypothetical protein